jgi:hypothetical protein
MQAPRLAPSGRQPDCGTKSGLIEAPGAPGAKMQLPAAPLRWTAVSWPRPMPNFQTPKALTCQQRERSIACSTVLGSLDRFRSCLCSVLQSLPRLPATKREIAAPRNCHKAVSGIDFNATVAEVRQLPGINQDVILEIAAVLEESASVVGVGKCAKSVDCPVQRTGTNLYRPQHLAPAALVRSMFVNMYGHSPTR